MEPPTPDPADSTRRAPQPPPDRVGQIFQELRALVALGLSSSDILLLARILERVGDTGMQAAIEHLRQLGSESEKTLSDWLNLIAKAPEEPRGRQAARTPKLAIDNDASTATSSHNYLHPQAALQSSTKTRSASPSEATSITNSSVNKRIKLTSTTTPKTKRKHYWCPECLQMIKNGFEKHFKNQHLGNIFAGITLSQDGLIGCGYCPGDDLNFSQQGKSFEGVEAFLRHVLAVHSQQDSLSPARIPWDFDAAFKNLLSGNVNIRRDYDTMIKKENMRISRLPEPYNIPPIPSFSQSSSTQALMGDIQTFGGRTKGEPYGQLSAQDKKELNKLLERVYTAVFGRPYISEAQIYPRNELLPTRPLPHQAHPPAGDPLAFTVKGVGGGAYDASKAFGDAASPLSPMDQARQTHQTTGPPVNNGFRKPPSVHMDAQQEHLRRGPNLTVPQANATTLFMNQSFPPQQLSSGTWARTDAPYLNPGFTSQQLPLNSQPIMDTSFNPSFIQQQVPIAQHQTQPQPQPQTNSKAIRPEIVHQDDPDFQLGLHLNPRRQYDVLQGVLDDLGTSMEDLHSFSKHYD